MKKVLLLLVGLVIVFGFAVTGFCQDLTKDLQVTIKADKDVYKMRNTGGLRGGKWNDYSVVPVIKVEIELKNTGNNEVRVRAISAGTFEFEFEPEVSLRPLSREKSASRREKTPFITLKPQEISKNTAFVDIETENASEYRISGHYMLDEDNYVDSNTISIKIIEEKVLEVIIKSNKKVYTQNEPVLISGIIRNISGKEAFLELVPYSSPALEMRSIDPVYRSVHSSRFKLTIVKAKLSYEKPYHKFAPYEEKIFRPHIHNLKWFWYSEDLRSPFTSDGLTKPGRYTIRLIRFGYRQKGEKFESTIGSKPITIEVVGKEE